MNFPQPGIREIPDLEAEAARLAEARKLWTEAMASYTFDAFVKAFGVACANAWDNGKCSVRVALPEGVFPHLTSVQNVMTREVIMIDRVPMFSEVPHG